METESYLISFFGLDPQRFTIGVIGDIWNAAAAKVYETTRISIVGEVYDRYFVDPADKDLNGSIVFMVESKRVPETIATEVDYWNAYKTVFEEVRKELGYPKMNLTIIKILLSYFVGF